MTSHLLCSNFGETKGAKLIFFFFFLGKALNCDPEKAPVYQTTVSSSAQCATQACIPSFHTPVFEFKKSNGCLCQEQKAGECNQSPKNLTAIQKNRPLPNSIQLHLIQKASSPSKRQNFRPLTFCNYLWSLVQTPKSGPITFFV